MPVVTALREHPRGRVAIDLDGAHWRLVPADAVVRANLFVGRALDRETARSLGRELRRSRALDVAARALRHRDLSRARLDARLADRGAAAGARAAALEALERAGLVDDARVASARAHALADRGYGDAAIRFALENEGLAGEAVADALAGLEPEPVRARALVERERGGIRTLRRLAARGFDPGIVEDLVSEAENAGEATDPF
jgi:SOS response regulatory protein OraA/RecX